MDLTDHGLLTEYPGAVEVILTKKNIEVTCSVYRDDEKALAYPAVNSVSMRGAQREITAALLDIRYEPVGRWDYPAEDKDGYQDDREAVRVFRRNAHVAAAIARGEISFDDDDDPEETE